MRTYRTRRRERRCAGPGWTSTSGVGGRREERRAGGHSRSDLVDRDGARSTGDRARRCLDGAGADGTGTGTGTGGGAGGGTGAG